MPGANKIGKFDRLSWIYIAVNDQTKKINTEIH
jgi:hypothetical protein